MSSNVMGGVVLGRLAALSMAVALSVAWLPPALAEKVSSAVGKPLIEAQKSIQSGNLDGALPLLAKARAAAKTPFEKLQVSEMFAFTYSKQRNYGAAADAFETSLSLNQYSGQERSKRLNQICQMRYQARSMDKALEACTRVAKDNPSGATYGLLASMYRQQRQYAASNNAIQSALRAGGSGESENLLQMLYDNYFELRDIAGQRRALEQLVALKPSRDNWLRLQSLVEQKLPPKPRMDLDMARLRYVTGVISKPDQYMELAQLALEANLPAEAISVLAKGTADKVLGSGPGKSREDRLINKAKADSAAGQRELAAFDREAQAAKDGAKDLQLGQRYVSYGKQNEGIAAIKRAMGKGGIDAGEGQLRLGQSYYAAGKYADALKSFNAVPASSPFNAVAGLWSIQTRAK